MANEFLQGLSIGAGIGQGIARNRLAQQQFKSVEAERMMRERLLAAQAAKYAAEVQRQQAMDEEAKQAFDRWSLLQEFGSPEEKSQFQQDTLFGQAIRTGDPRFLRQNQREFQHQALIQDINRLEADGDYDTAAALRAQLQAAQTRAAQGAKGLELRGEGLELSKKRLLSQEQREALRMQYQQMGLNIRQIDQAMKLAESGFVVDTPPAPIQGQAPQRVPTDEEILGPEPTPEPIQAPVIRRIEKPVSAANVTGLQDKVLKSDKALQSVDDSIGVLVQNPDAAGFVGAAMEGAEGLLGQLGIDIGQRVTTARTNLRDTAQQLVEALRVDVGAMSDWERTMLDQIGNPLKWQNDAKAAAAKLLTLRRLIALRSIADRSALNQSIPKELFSGLNEDDLANAFERKYIDKDTLKQEIQRRKKK